MTATLAAVVGPEPASVEDAYAELDVIRDRVQRTKDHEARLYERRTQLSAFLIANGEKQAVVARRAGVSPSRIDQTVNGKTKAPRPSTRRG